MASCTRVLKQEMYDVIHILKYLGFFLESEERYGERLVWKNQVLLASSYTDVTRLEQL